MLISRPLYRLARQYIMHYRLLMALLLLLPTLGLANKEARPQPSYFPGAPKDASGTFSNYAGELSHGSVSVQVPFMLRRFGTYFRSGADAPQPLALSLIHI